MAGSPEQNRRCCASSKHQKHPCSDCLQCQFCSDPRCAVCRGETPRAAKLSMAEQIALYERLNAEDRDES